MQSDQVVISKQRTLWAEDIARIMWGSELKSLSVVRQAGCHQVAFYTQRLFDGLEHSDPDEGPKR